MLLLSMLIKEGEHPSLFSFKNLLMDICHINHHLTT